MIDIQILYANLTLYVRDHSTPRRSFRRHFAAAKESSGGIGSLGCLLS